MATTKRKAHTVPVVEWVAGGAGAVVVAVTLLLIGSEAYRGAPDLADLRVEVERAVPRNGGHSVRVVVRNAGRRAAEAVIVEGTAGDLRGEAHIDYVAGESERYAILVFPEPPDRAALTVRVVGYTTP